MLRKLRWAFKLLRSTHYVVLTDQEAVINFDGEDPASFDNAMLLAQQASALSMFATELDRVSKQHDDVLEQLIGRSKVNEAYARTKKTRAKTTVRKNTIKQTPRER